MDQKILQQLAELQKTIADIVANMVTKDDLKNLITKDDVKNFATKDDLVSLEKRFEEKFVTKEYLDFALKKQSEAISKDMSDVINGLFVEVDEKLATKVEIVQLEHRVDKLEQKIAS